MNFASCALCRCLSSSSSLSPILMAAFPPASPLSPSSVLSNLWKEAIARSNSCSRDLMFALCCPSAFLTLPDNSFSRVSSSSDNVFNRDSACSNVRINGFGSNALLVAAALVPEGALLLGATAESESDSTKSLTMKSLLEKVSRV